jgi:hypothetical protein
MPPERPSIARELSPRIPRGFDFADVPGIASLWTKTAGDPRVRIAILDGPVDRQHPCLAGARIEQPLWSCEPFDESTCSLAHGTEIASIIFGQPETSLVGIAPRCDGLSIPIFDCSPFDGPATSQTQLARAISLARGRGALVINISAGQLAPSEFAEPLLADAIRQCLASGTVVIAAAGNDGCECLHLPAALPNVLSVGAMSLDGRPLASSNWGSAYRSQGILALGEHVPVAGPGGRRERRSGTSYSTAIVSGVVGLLISRQLALGRPADALAIRDALLASATGCDDIGDTDNRRCLAGRLNISGAISYLDDRSPTMTDETRLESPTQIILEPRVGTSAAADVAPLGNGQPAVATQPSVQPSACTACGGEKQLVYAIGQLGHDFETEATLDAFKQRMRSVSENHGSPHDERHLLYFLQAKCDKEPWHATSCLWTLNLSGVPRYVIRPDGPYARECYERLLQFYNEQVHEGVERVAVPGRIAGTAKLLSGRTVPVIAPDLRGFCNWTTKAVVKAALDAAGCKNADGVSDALKCFLDRIYHEMHNSGLAPQERALNYAGTNLFECREILSSLDNRKTLDKVQVEHSRMSRPGSDCWDVTLSFFDANEPLQTVRKVYRYTVDVSDVIPVTVGEVRSWPAVSV